MLPPSARRSDTENHELDSYLDSRENLKTRINQFYFETAESFADLL